MNIQKMLKEAQRMQERMAEAQNALSERTVEGTSGGGAVKAVATGSGDIVSVKIDPKVVDPADVEMLEDLVLSAVQQAIGEAKTLAGNEMSKLTGGLKIPGF